MKKNTRQALARQGARNITQRILDAHWGSQPKPQPIGSSQTDGTSQQAQGCPVTHLPECPRGMPWGCLRVQFLPGMGPSVEISAGLSVCSCCMVDPRL